MNFCVIANESIAAHVLAFVLRKFEYIGRVDSVVSIEAAKSLFDCSEVNVIVLDLVPGEADALEMIRMTATLFPDAVVLNLGYIRPSKAVTNRLAETHQAWVDLTAPLSSMVGQIEARLGMKLCERPLPELPSLKIFSPKELSILEVMSAGVPLHTVCMMTGMSEPQILEFMVQATQRMRANSRDEMMCLYQYVKEYGLCPPP